MSDQDSAGLAAGIAPLASSGERPAAVPVGAQLRALREQRGLSQEDVSVRLKFGIRQIRALEEERWSDLPHGMSLRGFVRNYARLLEVDPEPLLRTMSPAVQDADPVSLDQASFLSSPLAKSSKSSWPVSGRRKPAPWLIGGGMLIVALALLGYALMQQGKLPFGSNAVQTALDKPLEVPVPAEPSSSAVPGVLEQPAATPGAPTTIVEPVTPGVPAAPVPGAAPAPATAAPASPAAAGTTRLNVVANSASWVEVRLADGSVPISRILQAGERYDLDAVAVPIRVVIGNASGVTLTWRGAATDLAPYRRDNVARLTLQ